MNTPSPSPIRVLLVDDQALVRSALAILLETSQDVEIVGVAGTIDEAVESTRSLQPDVVLLDVLPDSTIKEGVGSIQRAAPRTKILILDESPRDPNVVEALRSKTAGYLTKQQPVAQIELALRLAMRGQRVYVPSVARRLVLSPEGVRLSTENSESPLACLTVREKDVLIYLAQGYTVKQCAELLGIGASTVGNHKSRLMKKLDIHKTVELTRLAIREGLIPEGSSARRRSPAHDSKTP